MECTFHGQRNFFVFMHTIPELSSIVTIREGLVIRKNSKMLRKLCEMNENQRGLNISWSCRSKGDGRLDARCSHAGKKRNE